MSSSGSGSGIALCEYTHEFCVASFVDRKSYFSPNAGWDTVALVRLEENKGRFIQKVEVVAATNEDLGRTLYAVFLTGDSPKTMKPHIYHEPLAYANKDGVPIYAGQKGCLPHGCKGVLYRAPPIHSLTPSSETPLPLVLPKWIGIGCRFFITEDERKNYDEAAKLDPCLNKRVYAGITIKIYYTELVAPPGYPMLSLLPPTTDGRAHHNSSSSGGTGSSSSSFSSHPPAPLVSSSLSTVPSIPQQPQPQRWLSPTSSYGQFPNGARR